MKRLILALVVVASLALPSIVTAEWGIAVGSNGSYGVSVSSNGNRHHNRSVVHHRSHRRVVVHHRSHRRVVTHHHYNGCGHRVIHRQEGRRYVNEGRYYSERIVVVPSGRSRSTYYNSYRY